MQAASPASYWWAMPSRPPAPPQAPAATRSSRTSSGSAMSTSRSGSPPTGWMRRRSPRSMPIPSSGPATNGRRRRRSISAWSRPRQAPIGRHSAGRASWPGRFRALAAARRCLRPGTELPRSLLLVVLVLIILKVVVFLVVILAVVIGLSRSAVRLVHLVVPQLAIGAVLREQLGMRAALDRPAP